MRSAFEAAKVTPGAERSPLVRRCVRVMEHGAGIKQRRRPQGKPRHDSRGTP